MTRSNQRQIYHAHCHCGTIGFNFRTLLPPEAWATRSCQCNFCRAHAACTTTDPNGSAPFQINDRAHLHRYQFGTKSTDFLICQQCGVYLAAVLTTDLGQFATLNVNTIQSPIQVAEAIPVSYDGETLAEKIARRQQRWTPVTGGLQLSNFLT